MATQTIPVPAESLRRLAEGSTAEVRRLREKGLKHSARSLQNDISTALEATAGNDGEFVSVPASVVSSLTADGTTDAAEVPEVWRHAKATRTYLEQYGYW